MYRVLGNSSERVTIHDLNDVIYYRQQKVYTDHEFEDSKDLDLAIKAGRVTKLEHFDTVRSDQNSPEPVIIRQQQTIGISPEDIKSAVTEAIAGLPKQSNDLADVRKTVMEILQSGQKSIDIKALVTEALKEHNGKISLEDIRKIVRETIPAGDNKQDIKKILTDLLNEYKAIDAGTTLQLMMQNMIPMLTEAVRQEIAKMPKGPAVPSEKKNLNIMFSDPTYVPEVSVAGMTANVLGEERMTTSGNGDMASSLEALKALKK